MLADYANGRHFEYKFGTLLPVKAQRCPLLVLPMLRTSSVTGIIDKSSPVFYLSLLVFRDANTNHQASKHPRAGGRF